MTKITQSPVEEFQSRCNVLMAKASISKKELATKLAIEPGYFSRLYNGKKPLTSHILERLHQLEQGGLQIMKTSEGGSPSRDWLEAQFDFIQKMIREGQRETNKELTLLTDRVSKLEEKKIYRERPSRPRTAESGVPHREEKTSR